VFVAATRVAVHRFGVPLVAAVPVVWTGLEYVQAHLLTGFSWYYLAHTQHAWTEIIQISDVVGAYGVSFVVAMTAAAIAGLLPDSLFDRFRLLPEGHTAEQKKAVEGVARVGKWQLAAALGVFAAVLAYGFVRRGQAEFREGPRIALIQGNFTSAVKHEKSQQSQFEIYRKHDQLTGIAVTYQPDLVVWPETMFPWPLGVAGRGMSDRDLKRVAPFVNRDYWTPFVRDRLTATAQRANAALLIGIDRLTADKQHGFRHFNSAQFVTPKQGLGRHYDKVHRVLFGEYIPFKESFPWLSRLTPYSDAFGIAQGSGPVALSHAGYRFVPLICFEDTVPHLVTRFLRETEKQGERVDCLVNLTNDGWFHGSSELNQHLITARFRCVETRTPMVRAVNTGISAIIDGDGLVREPDVFIDGDASVDAPPRTSIRDKKGRLYKQLNAALVDSIPLDNRRSVYTAGGDWFAIACAAAVVLLVLSRFVPHSFKSASSKSEIGSRKSEQTASA
jgi:apolipoprotein N-acyltransferase